MTVGDDVREKIKVFLYKVYLSLSTFQPEAKTTCRPDESPLAGFSTCCDDCFLYCTPFFWKYARAVVFKCCMYVVYML